MSILLYRVQAALYKQSLKYVKELLQPKQQVRAAPRLDKDRGQSKWPKKHPVSLVAGQGFSSSPTRR